MRCWRCPAFALWVVDALAVCLLLGAFCARFRDIAPIIGSVMQIAFFLTPVIWQPEQLGRHVVLLPFNPFFALLEIVRAPLLGHDAVADDLARRRALQRCPVRRVVALFVRARGRIAFWI